MNIHITNSSAAAASDGLDMQQRAMGVAGQLAALLEQPSRGDAQQIAMGSASQSLLAAAQREVGGYVSNVASAEQPGSYISTGRPQPVVANSYVSSTAARDELGSYVSAPAS